MPLIQIFNPDSVWTTPSAGSLHKYMEEGSFYFFSACSHLASTSIPSLALEPTFQKVIQYTAGQLRCSVFWTEQVLGSWTFHP